MLRQMGTFALSCVLSLVAFFCGLGFSGKRLCLFDTLGLFGVHELVDIPNGRTDADQDEERAANYGGIDNPSCTVLLSICVVFQLLHHFLLVPAMILLTQ